MDAAERGEHPLELHVGLVGRNAGGLGKPVDTVCGRP
jgi:hypothetical protein